MISADVWVGTNPLTMQLVVCPGAHQFKVECLVERAQHCRVEPQLEGHLTMRRHNPAKRGQPSGKNGTLRRIFISVLDH